MNKSEHNSATQELSGFCSQPLKNQEDKQISENLASQLDSEVVSRVINLLELWKVELQNRNGIIWNDTDAGDSLRLWKSINELEAAIYFQKVESIRPESKP